MDRRAIRRATARRSPAANTAAAEAPSRARAATSGGGSPPARASCRVLIHQISGASAAALAVDRRLQLALVHSRAPADVEALRVVVELVSGPAPRPGPS